MWIRSLMAYRVSFAMTALGNFAVTAFDFAAILLMFFQVDRLGGYSLAEIALLYGVWCAAFGFADLVIGSMDRLGRRVRDGTLDTLLVRPAPVLAQVAADRFGLHRVGRLTQGALVLAYALVVVDVAWTPLKVAMVPMMLLCGAGIFAARRRAERCREVDDDQDADRHPHAERRPAAGGGDRPLPRADPPGPPHRRGLRPAHHALVGPAR
ncbi:hypothetical protein SALBM135S_03544 [Streptomyces alboniger]